MNFLCFRQICYFSEISLLKLTQNNIFEGSGELIHIYQTGQPQTTALNSMGLHKEREGLLYCIPFQTGTIIAGLTAPLAPNPYPPEDNQWREEGK